MWTTHTDNTHTHIHTLHFRIEVTVHNKRIYKRLVIYPSTDNLDQTVAGFWNQNKARFYGFLKPGRIYR